MNVVTQIEVYEIDQDSEYAEQIDKWSCGLWWSDFEEADIKACYIAVKRDRPVGFQTVNSDGLCIAIEVDPQYQGQGIASQLIKESGCWRPDRNENPEFWSAIQENFGW